MAFVTNSWFIDIIIVIATVLIYLHIKLSTSLSYWKKRGVATPKPTGYFGHLDFSQKRAFAVVIQDFYRELKNEKLFGVTFLGKHILFIKDPELIKTMLVKDFNSFHDRGFYTDTKVEPLTGHLFFMNGQAWRNLRIKLTPTFTSGKMRLMFPTLIEIGKQLTDVFEEGAKQPDLEVKEILARYTTDVISSCAFGIETNSLKDPDAEFRKMGAQLMKPSFSRYVSAIVLFVFPTASRYLPVRNIPPHVSDFFLRAVSETMDYRETNSIHRNDFMQLLIQLKNKGYVADADNPVKEDDNKEKQRFTLEEAAAQAFIFFFAGFETSSTTLMFALYELSVNPILQEQVQQEIDMAKLKHGGEVTYEGMQEMELLGRVVAEVLRKYPISALIVRECSTEYKIPDSDSVLEKKTKVWFPVYAIHRDPEYYPEPEKFDPDRFLPEEKAKRHQYSYIPFGEGPRNCIGDRFALMQVKAGLIMLLSRFQISPSERTPIPLEIDPKADLLSPKGPLYFKISNRKRMNQ